MEDKTIEKIQETIVYDWQKPNLSKIERADIIIDYMKRKAYSINQMAKQLNIPKTTLFGWLLFGKMSEEEYNTLKKKGFSETDIFNKLKARDNNIEKLKPYELHLNQALLYAEKVEKTIPKTVSKITYQTLSKLSTVVFDIKKKTEMKVSK